MQHSLLRGKLDTVKAVDKHAVTSDGVTVVVAEAYRHIVDPALIFPTIVEEDDLRQFVLVEARPKGDDEVIVGIKRFGQPLSTPGLNLAVVTVAELLEQHGLEVVSRHY